MTSRPARLTIVALLCLDCALALFARAELAGIERKFALSKSELELTLQSLPGYPGGKLPTLEGFVVLPAESLQHYQRAYYQYSADIQTLAPHQVKLALIARVTAWYADEKPSRSEYRVLESNGRLEADLMDALDAALRKRTAATSPVRPSSATTFPAPPHADSSFSPIHAPNAPPATTPALIQAGPSEADLQRIRKLSQEERDLQEILSNQSHPKNLAAVKKSGSPVTARPEETAKVLFLAQAEDQFQILDQTDKWVHVQISGLSRGWIRRAQVELPDDVPAPVGFENAPPVPGHELFQQSRDETAIFPGDWPALKQKQVRILTVRPIKTAAEASPAQRWEFARSLLRKLSSPSDVAGVALIFDSSDGGIAATTTSALQQWISGKLTDDEFRKQCWFDPPDAFFAAK